MAKPKYNNTAGRLLMIFAEVQSYPDNMAVREVWAKLFGFDRAATARIFRSLVLLDDLLRSLLATVESGNSVHKELIVNRLPAFFAAVSCDNLSDHWAVCKRFLTPEAMLALEFCANELPTYEEIETNELDGILAGLEELFHDVMSRPIDADLKRWIAELLNQLMVAVREYWITGADGLRRTASYTAAEMARHASEMREPENEGWAKPLYSLWKRVNNAVEQVTKFGRNIEGAGEVIRHLGFDPFSGA